MTGKYFLKKNIVLWNNHDFDSVWVSHPHQSPGSWLDWSIGLLIRKIGTLLQSRIEGVAADFANSAYAQRVKDNPKLYGYIDTVIQDYLDRTANTRSVTPANDESFEFTLPV